MFWGLILKQGKKYSKVVEQDFHLTHAALDLSASSGDVQVMLTSDDITYLLCTLNKSMAQVHLDHQFAAGDEISFATKGQGVVHLSGSVLPDEFGDMDGDEEDEEDDEMEMEANGDSKARSAKQAAKIKVAKEIASGKVPAEESDEDDATFTESMVEEALPNGDEEGDDDDDDDEDDDDEDDEEEDGDDDEMDDDDDDDDDDEEDDDEEDDDDEEEDEEKQKQQKKAAGKPTKQQGKESAKPVAANDSKGSLNGNASAKEAPKKQEQQKGATRTLQDGLIVEDLKVGTGTEAKPGKKVAVYYEGRLKANNKVFDSTNKGAGLKFNLGRGEVIKGWDLGVAGMKVGGKRRLVIPHKLAYGNKGSPPVIPPCSTLVFEVELKKVF
uniref:FK506-binding protein n=1 Tax=Anopheles atroparvus TaxID=41427 RepID=A0AAG5D743_ANOAO